MIDAIKICVPEERHLLIVSENERGIHIQYQYGSSNHLIRS